MNDLHPGTAGRPATARPAFDGDTYDEERDGLALSTQLSAVRHLLESGDWFTLAKLARQVRRLTGRYASEASVSARIRDLRKDRYGAHDIDHECLPTREWRYRMRPRPPEAP